MTVKAEFGHRLDHSGRAYLGDWGKWSSGWIFQILDSREQALGSGGGVMYEGEERGKQTWVKYSVNPQALSVASKSFNIFGSNWNASLF